MATSLDFAEYVCEQITGVGEITVKKMFGEYGLYCNGKIIGLICDNQLFIKKTEEGAKLLKEPFEAPPYPSAKPYFLIDNLEDREELIPFLQATYEALPWQKPRRKKKDREM